MNAQQIVQLHRNAAATAQSPLAPTDLTLTAAIEHLVWRAAHAHHDGHDAHDFLSATLDATQWPATTARDVVDGNIGTCILPPHHDLILLRHVESQLRTSITNSGFTPMTAKALTGAITEIITNIWEHARSTSPALLAYQLDPERVAVGIADLGIGVLASLRSNPQYQSLTSSMAALKKAMDVGVSRLHDEGRGYGFDTVLRAVADQWGGVRLRTGEAILEFQGTSNVRHAAASYGVNLPGLQVAFSCGTSPPTTTVNL